MITLTEIFPINDTKIRFGEETFSNKLINGRTVSFNTVFAIKFPWSHPGLHSGIRWYSGDMLISDSRNRNYYLPNDRVHVSQNGSLTVENVQDEDTGDYYCEIIFSNAPPIRQEHSIEVQCKYLSYRIFNLINWKLLPPPPFRPTHRNLLSQWKFTLATGFHIRNHLRCEGSSPAHNFLATLANKWRRWGTATD